MDESRTKEQDEIMMDRYGSLDVSEIVKSPQFIAEFEDWVEQMEKEFADMEETILA